MVLVPQNPGVERAFDDDEFATRRAARLSRDMLHRASRTAFTPASTFTMHVPIVGIVGPRAPLKVAVQAAIDAYAASGHMLDAALAYAAHGYPVFPLSHKKRPVPPRDKDASGKSIPGTGSFYKATTDQVAIHQWWDKHEHL